MIADAPLTLRRLRIPQGLMVAIVSATAIYLAIRIIGTDWVFYPTAVGACTRIAEAGLGPTANDWFCHMSLAGVAMGNTLGTLNIVIGLVLPGMFLAATGRRLTALIPLLAAPYVASSYFGDWGLWLQTEPRLANVAVWAMIAVPAIAVMVLRRREPDRRRVAALPWLAVSALVVGLGASAVFWLSRGLIESVGIFGDLSMEGGLSSWLLGPFIVIALFGALLGSNRRMWFGTAPGLVDS